MLPGIHLQDNCWNIHLFGLETVFMDRGDLLVLANPKEKDPPLSQRTPLIRRIIALPGELIEIKQRKISIDSKLISSYNPSYTYRFNMEKAPEQAFMEEYSISLIQETAIPFCYDAVIQEELVDVLSADVRVSHCRILDDPSRFKDIIIYPFSMTNAWTLNDYGPYLVPAKGTTIELNSENIERYKHLLVNYEGVKLETENQQVIINGHREKNYVFKNDYYFVLSDNRDFGSDSRTFGPVPESLIRGLFLL